MKLRRIVTGHDASGKAAVLFDSNVERVSKLRKGCTAGLVWSNEGFPVDNCVDFDEADRDVATSHPGGVVFRVIDYEPGVAPRSHRTQSMDYAVVLAGEICMELEPGSEVVLHAGDVLVQRGTIHNWINRGDKTCRIAFVLIDAAPISHGGKKLEATG